DAGAQAGESQHCHRHLRVISAIREKENRAAPQRIWLHRRGVFGGNRKRPGKTQGKSPAKLIQQVSQVVGFDVPGAGFCCCSRCFSICCTRASTSSACRFFPAAANVLARARKGSGSAGCSLAAAWYNSIASPNLLCSS